MRSRLLTLVGLLGLVGSGPSWAYDFTIDASTAVQAYQVTGPGGSPDLDRRRILQTLRLGAYDFLPRVHRGPRLSFVLGLRLDSDFGIDAEESDPLELRTRYVPGLAQHDLDLMYGWVDGRGLLNGWLDFRVGRQLQTDSLGWFSFDGGLVRLVTPFWLQLETYAGVEVVGGMRMGPSTFELDGSQKLPRPDALAPADYSSIDEPPLAPVFGAALETKTLMLAHGRLTFREVQAEGRIRQRALGYSANVTPIDALTARGSFAYDLHLSRLSELTIGVETQPTGPLVVGLEYVRFVPTFDADSIWNFFPVEPMNDVRLRAELDPLDGLELASLFFGRLSSDQGPIEALGIDGLTDVGGSLTARGRNRVGELSARLHGSDGYGGLRLGTDLFGLRLLWNGRVGLKGRLSLWRWDDDLRSDRNGVAFAYVLGGQFRLSQPATIHLELEHDINHVVGHRLRMLALIDLRFVP